MKRTEQNKSKKIKAIALTGFLIAALLVGLLAPLPVARAETFYVDSVLKFQNALNTAANNGEDDTINVAAGTYNVATTLTYDSAENHTLTIVGAGTGSTILDGGDSTQILNIRTSSPDANITVRNITFQKGNISFGFGGGLRVEVDGGLADITIEECEFKDNSAPDESGGGGGVSATVTSGTVTLRGNTFNGNSAAGNDAGGAFIGAGDTGTATVINNTFINGTTADDAGGVMLYSGFDADNVHFRLSGNTFTNNSVGADPVGRGDDPDGGGAFAYMLGNNGEMEITNNTFDDNQCYLGGAGLHVRYTQTATVTLRDNDFTNNSATTGSGGGANLDVYDGSVNVENNTFNNNTAPGEFANGGGLWVSGAGSASLAFTGNTFSDNHAHVNGAGANLYSETGEIELVNNIFDSNTAVSVGGGLSIATGTVEKLTLRNDAFYGNSGSDGGGVYFYTEQDVTLNICNEIIWNSTGQAISHDGGSVMATYSDIQGGTGQAWFGTGCMDTDPLFVDPGNDDFHLQSTAGSYHDGGWTADENDSPCIDAGDPTSSYDNEPEPNGNRINMGTYGNTNQASKSSTPWEDVLFDTGEGTYPSIMGTHNGTIKPSHNISVSRLYTYPCLGTGGHTESIELYENGKLIANGTWNGYVGDWHNITITPSVTLLAGHTYNYTIVTGSYPQIIHAKSKDVTGGTITCTSFVDANGKTYTDWIPAIRLE
ncbi:MAG: right-handed parallel beta-helix repeat-containing protein [Candidatus Syntrophoarchaeum sp.]|nr:right-handed parallel beta-helix repeat-containing protein [Candidatus Syntrophoarchaeum sp.]